MVRFKLKTVLIAIVIWSIVIFGSQALGILVAKLFLN